MVILLGSLSIYLVAIFKGFPESVYYFHFLVGVHVARARLAILDNQPL